MTLSMGACDVSRPVRVQAPVTCEPFPDALWVSTDCELGLVSADVLQDGCALRLTLEGQEVAVLQGELDGSGAFAVQATRGPTACVEVTARAGALRRFSCERPTTPCAYDLFAQAEPTPPRIDRAAIISAPFRTPANVVEGRNRVLDGFNVYEGYLSSAVLLPGGAWVATASGAYTQPECREAATLVHVEGNDGGLVMGAPLAAPPCLRELIADPLDRRGFLGLSAGDRPAVHRFGSDGTLIASNDLVLPASREARRTVFPLLLIGPVGTDRTLFVVATTDDKTFESWLIQVDLDTLAQRGVSEPALDPVRAASPVVRGRIFGADTSGGLLIPFHAADRGIDAPFSVNVLGGDTDDTGFISADPADGELVVATTGPIPLLYFADERVSPRVRGFARFYEREALPWASTPIGVSGITAVGLTAEAPPYRAYLARLVVAQRRFEPGAIDVGQGVVRWIAADGAGGVWLLLPWTGELVRVRP